jgi:hypothetical protein
MGSATLESVELVKVERPRQWQVVMTEKHPRPRHVGDQPRPAAQLSRRLSAALEEVICGMTRRTSRTAKLGLHEFEMPTFSMLWKTTEN